MQKSELIDAVSQATGQTKILTASIIDATLESIVATVAGGDTVTVPGFGTFKSAKREARTGRNPRTGDSLEIAASTSPKFTAGSKFKAAVNADI